MLPSPRLFKSRWTALLWAGGILWAAVDVAQSASPPADNAGAPASRGAAGDPVQAADLVAIANAVGE